MKKNRRILFVIFIVIIVLAICIIINSIYKKNKENKKENLMYDISYNDNIDNNRQLGYLVDGIVYDHSIHVFSNNSEFEVKVSNSPEQVECGGYYLRENGTYTVGLYEKGAKKPIKECKVTIEKIIPKYTIDEDNYKITVDWDTISKIVMQDANDTSKSITYESKGGNTIETPYDLTVIKIFDINGKEFTSVSL